MTTGLYWDVTNAAKPFGLIDPDEELDIPWDFASWLTQASTTYVSHTFTTDSHLRLIASQQVAGVITARVGVDATAVKNTKYPITCHLVDSAGQKKDQTLWFKIRDA